MRARSQLGCLLRQYARSHSKLLTSLMAVLKLVSTEETAAWVADSRETVPALNTSRLASYFRGKRCQPHPAKSKGMEYTCVDCTCAR